MIRGVKTSIIIALIPFALIACKKQEPEQQMPIKKAPAVQQPAVQNPEALDNSAGIASTIEVKRRNPFQSHIIVMKGVENGSQKPKGPLECCELNMFKLVAVVVSHNSYALIQAPDGKRYIVRHGDILGAREGKLVKIGDRGITVREFIRDEDGKVSSSADVELMLPDKGRK